MNKEDLGKKFYRDGNIYEAIAYSDNPTIELRNIDNDKRISVVVGSMYSKEFQLIENIQKENKELQDRINKAIEFITKNIELNNGALSNREELIVSKHDLIKCETNVLNCLLKTLEGKEVEDND